MSNINPKIGGTLATVEGEKPLAELEAHLDQGKASHSDPHGKLGSIREVIRKAGRVIIENSQPSEERTVALNILKEVFTNAKTAAFR